MDERLQQLKREAAVSGDYTSYETALARTGKTRIVLRRVTVAQFSNIGPEFWVQTTLWSNTDTFTIVDDDSTRGSLSRQWSNFTVDLTKLVVGCVVQGGWNLQDILRVLDIEFKELIVPAEYLIKPKQVSKPIVKQYPPDCANGETPCYLHGCVPCLKRGSIHPDTFPCAGCSGQIRTKWDNADKGMGWVNATLWRDITSPDDTCTCDLCYHPAYRDDWRMVFCKDCGRTAASSYHVSHCMMGELPGIPTDLST